MLTHVLITLALIFVFESRERAGGKERDGEEEVREKEWGVWEDGGV
jgi:hypothetical protein